jgi:two-component system LytT family sensor kinase
MTVNLKSQFNHLVRIRVLQHLLFWCLSFLILVNILKVSAEVKQIDIVYTAIFHIPILLVVYTNLRLLFPNLLEKGRYLWYSLAVLSLIAAGSAFYLLLFDSWIDYIFEGYYFIAYYSFWDISLYFSIYLFATSLLRLARGWFRLQEIETEKNKAELKALHAQINPHFLFNSLNSIYALARKQSKEVPDKIVQLSDLMRHVIYDTETDFIPLDKEIGMLKNYIGLQNLRSRNQNQIRFEAHGETEGKRIAPMMLLPFIENSFKHGIKGGGEEIFVQINLYVDGNILRMVVENNKGKSVDPVDEQKGIGIENVRKRLNLIYPGKHDLKILDGERIFKVDLRIQL